MQLALCMHALGHSSCHVSVAYAVNCKEPWTPCGRPQYVRTYLCTHTSRKEVFTRCGVLRREFQADIGLAVGAAGGGSRAGDAVVRRWSTTIQGWEVRVQGWVGDGRDDGGDVEREERCACVRNSTIAARRPSRSIRTADAQPVAPVRFGPRQPVRSELNSGSGFNRRLFVLIFRLILANFCGTFLGRGGGEWFAERRVSRCKKSRGGTRL